MLMCKTWTSNNFSYTSLDCYKNYTFQHFNLKICSKEDVLRFSDIVTVYNLSSRVNKYPLKFHERYFWDTLYTLRPPPPQHGLLLGNPCIMEAQFWRGFPDIDTRQAEAPVLDTLRWPRAREGVGQGGEMSPEWRHNTHDYQHKKNEGTY